VYCAYNTEMEVQQLMYIGNWTIQQQTNSRSVKLRKRSTRGLDDLWNSQLTDSKFF